MSQWWHQVAYPTPVRLARGDRRRNGRVFALLLAVCAVVSCGDLQEPLAEAGSGALGIDQDEAERLRALGYVDVAESSAEELELGVLRNDLPAADAGIVHFTNAHGCSAQLISAGGEVLHRWSHSPCDRWGNTTLLPDGDLLVIHRDPYDGSFRGDSEARSLLRLSWGGDLRWQRRMPFHHDAELTPRNQIATLTYEHRIIPAIDPEIPVRDHRIVLLSPEGELLEQASLMGLLGAAPDVLSLQKVKPQDRKGVLELDLLHSNSIEWMPHPHLAAQGPLYSPSNVLLTLRHQDAVVMIDWDRRRPVWAWGQGQLSGPHDATLLPSGNVLVFDNGLGRRWSRVVEVDPRSDEIVWEYRAPEPGSFFTIHRGACQRVANGNTLITDSGSGRLFEVDRDGTIVWDFRNPNLSEEGHPIVIVRARRLPRIELGELGFSRID